MTAWADGGTNWRGRNVVWRRTKFQCPPCIGFTSRVAAPVQVVDWERLSLDVVVELNATDAGGQMAGFEKVGWKGQVQKMGVGRMGVENRTDFLKVH